MTTIGEVAVRNVLEDAAAQLQAGGHVDWPSLVTQVLRLPVHYIPAVQSALAQGRWRTAKDPRAYLRRVARREAVKAEAAAKPKDTLRVPAHVRHEDGRRLSQQEYLEYVSYDDGPVKEHGVYRARNPLVEPVFADDGGRVVPVVKRRPVPEHLLMREDDEWDAKLTINWDEVEKKVGLDAQESAILRLRRRGFTRTMILQQVARNDEERRAWQAAWRRLDRKMGRLRAVLAGEQK